MLFFAVAETLANAAIKKKQHAKAKAFWVASITCNTGASGTELRNLRLGDVFLGRDYQFVIIRPETAKNNFRGRQCALNPTAAEHMRKCVEIAKKAGASDPEHYIFPWWQRGKYDVTKPATSSWLRFPWKKLQDAMQMPWLTPHCFRHQHITLRMEAGEPIESIAKDVGHSAVAMTRMYTHVRREQQKQNVERIDSRARYEKLLAKRTA
jgi:integrase